MENRISVIFKLGFVISFMIKFCIFPFHKNYVTV